MKKIKNKKEVLIGIFYIVKDFSQVMEDLIDEGLVNVESGYMSEKTREKGELPRGTVYIKAKGEVFRVSGVEEDKIERKIKEGTRVKFETPIKKTGKFRWAYSIKLY